MQARNFSLLSAQYNRYQPQMDGEWMEKYKETPRLSFCIYSPAMHRYMNI